MIPGDEFVIPGGKFQGYFAGGSADGDGKASDTAWQAHQTAAKARALRWENGKSRKTSQLTAWNRAAKNGEIPSWLKLTGGQLQSDDVPTKFAALKSIKFEVDHVIEHQMNGPDTMDNYQLLAASINKSVGPSIEKRIKRFSREHKNAQKLIFTQIGRGT